MKHSRPTSQPHLRLRNMYIGLFLVLGTILCIAEVSRQMSIAEQAERIRIVDRIRAQCDRVQNISDQLVSIVAEGDAVTRARDAAALPARIDQLHDSQHEFERSLENCSAVSANVCGLAAQASAQSDQLQGLSRSLHNTEAARDAALNAGAYNRLMQRAALLTISESKGGIAYLSSLSLMMFLILLGVVIFEALFLILPTTRSVRRQWEQMQQSKMDTQRLSDKFSELIESTAKIQGLTRSGKGTKIIIRPGDTAEAVFDFAQLRKVQASLNLFEAAVVNSRDGIVIVETVEHPRIIFANDAMLDLTGLSMDDLLGHDPRDLHSASPADHEIVSEALASEAADSLQTRQVRPNGSAYDTEIDSVPVSASGDSVSHHVLVYRDITARLESQRALQSSLDRFELIGRIALDGIYDLDLRTGACWRNEPLMRQFGKPEDTNDFFGWLRTRLHPEDGDDLIESFIAMTRSDRSSWQAEYRQLRTDGTWARVFDRATLLRDSSGTPIRLIGSLQDVTVQREQEWELLQSENRLREIINEQTELVCRYDADGVLIFVNDTYASYFETTPQALVGTSFMDLVPESGRKNAESIMDSLSPDRPVITSENQVLLPDGSVRWMRWTDRVILDAEGQIKAYQAVGRDITEEMVAKRELEQAESRYRAFIRNSYEAIFRVELDPPIDAALPASEQALQLYERGVFAEVNDAFSRQYGRETAADSVGLTMRDVFGSDPENIKRNLEQLEYFIGCGYQVEELDSYERRADGTPLILSNSAVGIVEDGRFVRVWGTQRDITESRTAQRQLKQTNTMLKLFIEHAPASVAMLDTDMRYIATSRRWLLDFDIEAESLIGAWHYDIFPDTPEPWREIHRRGLHGETIGSEDSMIAKDGSHRWYRWEVRPWKDSGGTVGGIMIFTEDITERKRNADRLREVNEQQTRLLAELDHRVKNALGGLLTLIEMGTQETAEVREYARSIARRVRSMASVHAMLSEAKWKPLKLVDIIKNITPGDTPGRIAYSGPDLLVPAQQATPLAMVLQELVSNSMKYGALSAAGASVNLTWSTSGTPEGDTEMKLVWRETGGPPVTPNPPAGLGTQLISGFARFELRGSIEFDFSKPEGVQHTLRCRLESTEIR